MSKLESVQKSVIINHISITKLNTLMPFQTFVRINQYITFAFKIGCFYPTVYGNVRWPTSCASSCRQPSLLSQFVDCVGNWFCVILFGIFLEFWKATIPVQV